MYQLFNFVVFTFIAFTTAYLAPGLSWQHAVNLALGLGIAYSLNSSLLKLLKLPTQPLFYGLITFVVTTLITKSTIVALPIKELEYLPIWIIFIFALILALVSSLLQFLWPDTKSNK